MCSKSSRKPWAKTKGNKEYDILTNKTYQKGNKRNQTEILALKSTTAETKNAQGINSRFEQAVEPVNLKTGPQKLSSSGKERKQNEKVNFWDTINHTNIYIRKVPGSRKRGRKNI